MTIIVNTGVLPHAGSEDYHCFLNEVLRIVINRNREHEFIILTQDADARKLFTTDNVAHVRKHNALRQSLAVKMWYDLKLPAILKKYKADLYISFDGLCSMTAGIPQIILLNDLSFLIDSPKLGLLRSLFYKRFMKQSLQKASTIICNSEISKKDVMLRYSVPANKIGVVYPAVKETFQPVNEAVKEEVRLKHSDGKNYFACTGAMRIREDLFNMLKAFSAFKKRQKSNWKLLLMGHPHQYDKKFMDSLATYKYRSDVVVATGHERALLTGSAYAVICEVYAECMAFPLLQALKCDVPVITADTPAAREIAGDNALYFDPADPGNIADSMMSIYKDESLRNALIEKGKVTANTFSFDKSATLFWEIISGTKAVFNSDGMD